jgi:hypothetical protein
MAINVYKYGQKVRVATYELDEDTGDPVEGTGLKDVTGTLADADAISLVITKPSGEQVTKADGELEHPGTGQYHYDQLVDENTNGKWYYFFEATGDVEAGDEKWFHGVKVHGAP